MSLSEVVVILERAEEDEVFKALLFSNSRKALEMYDLTESETSVLNRIGSDSFMSTKRGLVSMRKLFSHTQAYEIEEHSTNVCK